MLLASFEISQWKERRNKRQIITRRTSITCCTGKKMERKTNIQNRWLTKRKNKKCIIKQPEQVSWINPLMASCLVKGIIIGRSVTLFVFVSLINNIRLTYSRLFQPTTSRLAGCFISEFLLKRIRKQTTIISAMALNRNIESVFKLTSKGQDRKLFWVLKKKFYLIVRHKDLAERVAVRALITC